MLETMEEQPETLAPKTIYLLGEGENLWFVAMLCPCKCGAVIQTSLLQSARPRWDLVEHNDGTISLLPSIWRREGCRSHFFVKRNSIQWCRSQF